MLRRLLRSLSPILKLEARPEQREVEPPRSAAIERPTAAERPGKPPSSRERDIRRDSVFMGFYGKCAPFSMTTLERLFAVYVAVDHLVRSKTEGDIVECGVWRGGSMMMAALSLRHFGDRRERRLFLFDTFEGMPPPGAEDFKFDGLRAEEKWRELRRDQRSDWNYAAMESVREAMQSTGYPADRIVLVKGRVEETLPGRAPERIALLRLDTDFYSSTKHELTHLFPRLVPGGILILDDFGTWAGCRQAVEEYFAENGINMLLNRIDASGRIGIKLP